MRMIKIIKGIVLTVMIITLQSCSVEPEPIRYGKDSCEHCKMLIMDPKFGAEIVTDKGKIFKFDDINCMVIYSKKKLNDESSHAHILVTNFLSPETLIDAKTAFYASSDYVKSPMAAGVAVFKTEEEVNNFIENNGGTSLRWSEIKEMFK